MDAISFLKEQHRKVEALFEKFEEAEEDRDKRKIFAEIADNLAIHAAIEERYFYPAVRAQDIEEEVAEAYDEHLGVKKLILDCMDGTDRPGFSGLVAALKGAVEHHVREEEREMFPKVERIIDRELLEAVGERMEQEAEELMAEGDARNSVAVESEPPAVV